MKKSRKTITSFVSVLLAFVMMLALLTSCGEKANKVTPTASPIATLSPEEIAAKEAAEKEAARLADFKSRFYDNYQNENFDAKNIVLTFAAISDLHIGLYEQTAKVEKGMKFLSRRIPNGLDALLVNGDITNHFRASNNDKYITEASNVLINNIPENTALFYSLGTSHDADGFNSTTNKSGKTQREAFNKFLNSRFTVADIETEEERINKGYKHAIIKDYHFLSLDNENGSYSATATKWLKDTLKEITKAEPNKPVFVMTHIPADTALDGVLKLYPQVIYFSAHEHIPFNTPMAINQNKYTSLSIGGFGYYREKDVGKLSLQDNNNNYEYGQGYMVEVDKNGNTRVLRLDLYNEVVLNDAWVIPSPKDDSSHLDLYKVANYKNYAKAEFAEDAQITFEVDENNPLAPVKITFPAAKAADGQPIIMYNLVIKIEEGSGTSRTERYNISSLYMKYPNGEGMPDKYTVTVNGVAPPYSYDVTVKAYNCVDKISSALRGVLKTEDFNEILSSAESSAS